MIWISHSPGTAGTAGSGPAGGIGASSLPEEEIARFEEEHLAFLAGVPEPFVIPHYATVLNLRRLFVPEGEGS